MSLFLTITLYIYMYIYKSKGINYQLHFNKIIDQTLKRKEINNKGVRFI